MQQTKSLASVTSSPAKMSVWRGGLLKLWAILFVLWLALCAGVWAWLHPNEALATWEELLGQETQLGILPGDLPGYDAPPATSDSADSSTFPAAQE